VLRRLAAKSLELVRQLRAPPTRLADSAAWEGLGPARSQGRCGGGRPVPVQMWRRSAPVPVQMWRRSAQTWHR
jgi:hypothetical protein